MEIDKTLALQAPPQQVWALLLDPQAMGKCVPGMQSIEVVSPDEYVAQMQVKMAFITARFKLRTRIVERREPHYLVAEGTGEDASVASSLKQRTEMHLEPRDDNGTELRLKVQVELMGRMGAFGLAAMKTKADRLWDEFGVNLAGRLAGGVPTTVELEGAAAPAAAADVAASAALPAAARTSEPAGMSKSSSEVPKGWWPSFLRFFGVQPASPALAADMIVIEVRRPDQTHTRIEWPSAKSAECAQWLRETLR